MADIDQKAQALSDARARILKLQEQMEEEASAAKMPVTVTVIDVHGNSVLQHRMNGAIAFSMFISPQGVHRRS
ncbi:hypothetical protein AB9E25_34805, partial [Rhizobium leguminosarum]